MVVNVKLKVNIDARICPEFSAGQSVIGQPQRFIARGTHPMGGST
jgi:hypothetical protein